MDKNKIKIYLYKNKDVMAKFNRYVHGNLYYEVNLWDGTYQFPIPTIETNTNIENNSYIMLSADLGTTSFESEIKASFLNRWIDKAVDDGNLVKLW